MGIEQFFAAIGSMVDWVAVAFAVLATAGIRQYAFKIPKELILNPPAFTGWRAALQRFMPFVPVVMAVAYIVPTHWHVIAWRSIFNEGVASGTFAAWGYKALKDAIYGGG
jgi:hypothetical protein